ncbi:50S ribosomal protein L3 N(5)-glutamine methyltransferase [Pleionea sp. CnH1-48]|uniref:50S ribosomal protein L3 N(5)-glutamine methyltransferase n=1 Tax=Pleionea sp. CnH1-48 TaxID=2954494 RepID=UPI0020976077|nr:50S ribosomal protein L3 N(5)-glutamine methyltransferase [Pleionea sp. CnH1-48]MCO7222681.1 50S ribosomal protein L3 N(5)-glutamine methyltransferase [Pleionea sp. CnH1-48]
MSSNFSEHLAEAQSELHTIRDFLRWTCSRLDEADVFFGHGTDNPWDEAVALILPLLRLPYDCPDELMDTRLTTTEKQRLAQAIKQRVVHRVPVAYLTQQAYFCGLPFYVDERVLVPRSPIGELIERQFTPWVDPQNVHSVLDLCTGSGCIAIACAQYFPEAFVAASDISTDALAVAEYNCQLLESEHVCLMQSNLFDKIPEQQFDVIVSNPPYVDAEDMADLPDEFRSEPELGLAAGHDGLDLVHIMLQQAHRYLSEHGILIIEVGNSAGALEAAYPDFDFNWIEFERGGHGVFVMTAEEVKQFAKV